MTPASPRRFIAFLLVCSLPFPSFSQRSISPAPGIDHGRVYDFCRTLANDFGGRLTGDSGYTNAAHWVAGMFRQWGLAAFNDQAEYLQSFPAPFTVVTRAKMTLTLPSADSTGALQQLTLEPGKDFLPLFYTDAGSISGELVFAGWGIHAPQFGYDDYAGLDVRGKIVLCFRGVPNREDSTFQEFDEHRIRMQTAKDLGARALFYIYEEPIANPNGDLIEGFEPAMISYAVADKILKEKGVTATALEDSLSHSQRSHSFSLSSSVTYEVECRHNPKGTGYNVAGWLEGSDPKLKGEFVLLGAHLDHCGTHLGLTFPGANDNASGSAVVMAIANALAGQPRPKRSVAFVLFAGEEMGLLGSKFFVDHLPHQIKSTAAMVNFDMVGEGDGARCSVSARETWLRELLETADKGVNTLRGCREITRVGVRSSDFAPFFRKGIPCLSFSSNGPHLAYHKPGDSIYRINPDMLADVARLGLLCAVAAADR